MWSVMKKSALLGAALFVLATGSAQAATVEVKVPFPFVVQGQTLPAGQYRLQRDVRDPSVVLIRGEHGVKASMFVLTMSATGNDPAGERPVVTFGRHETQYRLADIWESGGQGREIVQW